MKKRTLNQTWVLCLRMWRWIAKEKAKKSRKYVATLKRQWFRENGFTKWEVESDCFFCGYTQFCCNCPGKLVDPTFDCNEDNYCYDSKPVAFYKELLRLNRIRKAKK